MQGQSPFAAGTPPVQPGTGYPQQSPDGTYPPSGLTAADLQWSSQPESGKGGVWKPVGAVAGVLVLLVGAAVGGYLVGDRGGDRPAPEPTVAVGDAAAMQKSLAGSGFECAPAFTRPVLVDLCFRENAEYRESVGFQMLDEERIGWLKLRVESTRPVEHPAKPRALELFGTVLDQALPAKDAESAKGWLSGNLPEDYEKNEYLVHEAGAARLQLLPRNKRSALLWVRMTAASYQDLGEKALPKVTAESIEEHYKAADFACKPTQGGVSCEKKTDAGTTVVNYYVTDGKIGAVRLTLTPTGKLDEIAAATRQSATDLIGLLLAGQDLQEAETWLAGAFDGAPHHTVLSGIEVRVAPAKVRSEARSVYEVDVVPANW